ncbi:IS5 family transposase [Spirosoma humi]
MWIVPHLSTNQRGPKPKQPLEHMMQAIFYKLKTGCQWRYLPLKAFFDGPPPCWQTVYHHFNKWANDGSLQQAWTQLLTVNKHRLDLSSIQLDGSHTLAKNGGQAVSYQRRKRAKTTNLLFLADNQGLPLACSTPQAGEHNDVFNIQVLFDELCSGLVQAGIRLEGLFLNADAGFDAASLRTCCETAHMQANIRANARNQPMTDSYLYFDELLYQRRVVIERTNAWLDGFKNLLVRFETKASNWLAFHWLAFCTLLLRHLKL